MAYLKFKGLQEYEFKLSRLEAGTDEIAGKAIYQGAKIVADEVKKNIETLPVIKDERGSGNNLLDGVTQKQKDGLVKSWGIAPMESKNGYLSVKLGFDGYNSVVTSKYPKGQPNVLIARAVESGTSFRKKHPFVSPAVKKTRKKAEAKMKEVLDEEINKIMKG